MKVLLSCVHDGYFWFDRKIDLNVGQLESCMVCLSLVLSLMSTESLIEVLMSTETLTMVVVCGLVPSLGLLWRPLCVLVCVVSGRPFPQIQAQV